jgi:hypothetical protein
MSGWDFLVFVQIRFVCTERDVELRGPNFSILYPHLHPFAATQNPTPPPPYSGAVVFAVEFVSLADAGLFGVAAAELRDLAGEG